MRRRGRDEHQHFNFTFSFYKTSTGYSTVLQTQQYSTGKGGGEGMFEQDAKLVGKVGCFEEGRCRINRECITYLPGLETREYEISIL